MYASIFGNTDVGPVSGLAGGGVDVGYAPADTGSRTGRHPLMPGAGDGFAWGFWLGVGGLVVLVFIRHNLPA